MIVFMECKCNRFFKCLLLKKFKDLLLILHNNMLSTREQSTAIKNNGFSDLDAVFRENGWHKM